MKKIVCATLLFTQCHVFADSLDVIPMSGITIGMSIEELEKRFPFDEYEIFKGDEDKIPEEGGLFYKVSSNEFWDTVAILIEDSKVQGLSYIYQSLALRSQNPSLHDSEKMVNNVKPLFRQLKKQLGPTFERKVIYRFVGETKNRSAMYVWKREKDVVAFFHSPIALYKDGDTFCCQLSIAQSLDLFGDEMATDSLPEDKLLWADAMGEEAVSFPNRWVYACAALGALCAIAYLMRRKR